MKTLNALIGAMLISSCSYYNAYRTQQNYDNMKCNVVVYEDEKRESRISSDFYCATVDGTMIWGKMLGNDNNTIERITFIARGEEGRFGKDCTPQSNDEICKMLFETFN